MLIVYVSSGCTNSSRFLECVERIPSLRNKVKIINVDNSPPSMLQGIDFVPTVVESGGNTYVGVQAFEFLKAFDHEIEMEPMQFGGGLTFSTLGGAAASCEGFGAFEPID